SNCYAVGDDTSGTSAQILATTNSGATWTTQSTQSGTLIGIACPSTSDCYAVGSATTGTNSLIVATMNSGATWSAQSDPSGLGGLHHVTCPSTSDCYAVGTGLGTNGLIMNTTNAGITWAAQSIPSGIPFLDGIACPSTSHCYASGLGGILATTDGGSTWKVQMIFGVFISSVACLSTNDCYAVGVPTTTSGNIFATTDAGTTWTAQSTPSGVQSLSGVVCLAVDDCYTVGQGGGSLGGLILSNAPSAANSPSITTASLPNGAVSLPYDQIVAVAGGTTPYTWSISAGSLPPGLSLNPNTGAITGTPSTSEIADFMVEITDSSSPTKSAFQPLSLVTAIPTTTTLSVDQTSSNFGQELIYTAQVSSPDGTPDGNVDFNTGSTHLCTVALNSSGGAECFTSLTPVGTDTVTALYVGSATFLNSSADVTVTVTAPPPPTVVLLPSNGATLQGGFWMDASGFSPEGILSVDFRLYGGSINEVIATGSPTRYGWISGFDSSLVPNGTYFLESELTDIYGNITTSAPITVMVANKPLATTVLVPSSGASVTNGSVLDASAMGLSPVTGVNFEVTGGSLSHHVVGTATLTLYGWIAFINTTGVSPGTYTLRSVATDATETATSPGITVSVM
ncbi:MAG TPA: Ig-like domain repeat protein, partial [Acidimicrobiales bacterium]|nr:Ig-like domain repeat protein [Acidimicrobiales bacterium]